MTTMLCTRDIFTLLPNKTDDWFDYTNPSIDTTDPQQERRWRQLNTGIVSTTPEVEASRNEWVTQAIPRLQKVAGLAHNWDNQGSPRTDPEIVAAAAYLLKRLQDEPLGDIPVPFVCPIAGGGFQFEWSLGQKHLELELTDKDTIVFLKEEEGPQGERMDSGQYPLNDTERTLQLLDWFTAA
ncbi:MAG: hypothetical protein KAV00_07935 [Phycisphaerae bacterium]|nr:hypothetical protein [Phycisphaerae bacterium]